MNKHIFLLIACVGVLTLAGTGISASDQPQTKQERSPRSKDRIEDLDSGRNIKAKAVPNEIGRVELSEKKIQNANLGVETAGPAKIGTILELTGKIALNEDAVANVSPRYTGVVKAVYKRL